MTVPHMTDAMAFKAIATMNIGAHEPVLARISPPTGTSSEATPFDMLIWHCLPIDSPNLL